MLRSDNGETWKEHTLEANEEAVQDVLNHSFEGEGINHFHNKIWYSTNTILFIIRVESNRRSSH